MKSLDSHSCDFICILYYSFIHFISFHFIYVFLCLVCSFTKKASILCFIEKCLTHCLHHQFNTGQKIKHTEDGAGKLNFFFPLPSHSCKITLRDRHLRCWTGTAVCFCLQLHCTELFGSVKHSAVWKQKTDEIVQNVCSNYSQQQQSMRSTHFQPLYLLPSCDYDAIIMF